MQKKRNGSQSAEKKKEKKNGGNVLYLLSVAGGHQTWYFLLMSNCYARHISETGEMIGSNGWDKVSNKSLGRSSRLIPRRNPLEEECSSEKWPRISVLTGPVISPPFPQSVDGKFMADDHVDGDHVMRASQLRTTLSVTFEALQS
ncbi:hypothetical protein CDAR_45221 [Caerostris darwini]|uniref:Uncharacterized protein n=1 Tax=Caerostris darwini TaxID=1538125 RepID=A0AAV4Q911_9ARAC|nr:hypothetical protein CDAR_45221 [Caerostris darwini]